MMFAAGEMVLTSIPMPERFAEFLNSSYSSGPFGRNRKLNTSRSPPAVSPVDTDRFRQESTR
jgi:hypothetical protein